MPPPRRPGVHGDAPGVSAGDCAPSGDSQGRIEGVPGGLRFLTLPDDKSVQHLGVDNVQETVIGEGGEVNALPEGSPVKFVPGSGTGGPAGELEAGRVGRFPYRSNNQTTMSEN